MYKIYLLDGVNYVELDCESLDMGTTFSVADVKDVSSRKDNISKNISFKGTAVNNNAFGNLFFGNKVSNSDLNNKLFFNYSPLRVVDCIVYEDGHLIMKGSLRVLKTSVKDGNIFYETVITGRFIELKNAIQDKYLTDLDFSDLKHHYNIGVIQDTWATQTERFDTDSETFSNTTFEMGSGYVYPFADYGVVYQDTTSWSNLNSIHGFNFRPAIFLKEYFDRIFKQPELDGFTYEVRGDETFVDKFNSLIVPNADELLSYTFSGFNLKFYKTFVTSQTNADSAHAPHDAFNLLKFNSFPTTPPGTIAPYVIREGSYPNVLYVNRTFTSDAKAEIVITSLHNIFFTPVTVMFELVERDAESNNDSSSNWTVLADTRFNINNGDTITNKTMTLAIGERTFVEKKQLGLRLRIHSEAYDLFSVLDDIQYNISTVELSLPKDAQTLFKVNVQLSSTGGDVVAPVPPDKVKQMDFIKSIVNLFNMYVYTENNNDKRLIFQQYDDYYAYASPTIITANAINWTAKLDYKNFELESNIKIPKNYLFTWKDDSDFVNADYKKKYGDVYGTFKFNDSWGVTDSKKVELIFSPSPMVQYAGTRRLHPAIYQIESGNKKTFKSNIRLLYYYGLKDCNEYVIGNDIYTGGWSVTPLLTTSQYPMVSNYLFDEDDKPVEDLYFGRPNEYYFTPTADYINAAAAYQFYYSNQITELTNPNIFIFQGDFLLTELDITNLDLRVPVYIDLGEFGHVYCKVLSIEYENKNKPSRVILQKIFIGAER